jgi:SAM-dependent methyltransferase
MVEPMDEEPGLGTIPLERPACPLCGETRARPALDGEEDWIPDGASKGLRFAVLRCLGCGVGYTSPRLPEAAKHLAFAGAYPFYERARRAVAPPSEGEMRAFDGRVREVTRAHPTPGTVLDIGMGDGAFLASMRLQGWTVAGLDIEPSVVAYAKSRLGIPDCALADVELDPLPAGPFDAITLWGMFQLAYHPQDLLEKLRARLAPGGILALGLSNFDSAGAKVFRSQWRGLGLPRHLVHYDATSLRGLLERSGYQVLGLAYDTPGWIVNGSMDATLRLPGLLGGAARLSARTAFGWLGGTRWGDTLTVVAAPGGS